MSRRYDDSYFRLFYEVRDKGFAFVTLTSAQEARNLRSYLYHFRRTLKEENHELAEFAAEIKFRIHPDGLELTLPRAPGSDAILQSLEE